MNYKDSKNKQQFEEYKKKTLLKLDNHINDMMSNNYKQSVNLTQWIENYTRFLKMEQTFDPKYRPVYARGCIVEVNFGFRIANEHGGPHFAIVLNKKDSKKNGILTVVPMSSYKGKTIHHSQVFLGDEFYRLVETKIDTSLTEMEKRLKIIHSSLDEIERLVQPGQDLPDNQDELLADLRRSADLTKKEVEEVKKTFNRYENLKHGGVALISQITTISKLRVFDPTKLTDPLANIVLSSGTMENIDRKIKEMFLTS